MYRISETWDQGGIAMYCPDPWEERYICYKNLIQHKKSPLNVGKYTNPTCFDGLRFDNYISIYVMFAVGALECIGLRLGKISSWVFVGPQKTSSGPSFVITQSMAYFGMVTVRGDSFINPRGKKRDLCSSKSSITHSTFKGGTVTDGFKLTIWSSQFFWELFLILSLVEAFSQGCGHVEVKHGDNSNCCAKKILAFDWVVSLRFGDLRDFFGVGKWPAVFLMGFLKFLSISPFHLC